jgi:hypothetical protein
VGHSLLFAVGAGPPHDGIRKKQGVPNLTHDLGRLEYTGFQVLNS